MSLAGDVCWLLQPGPIVTTTYIVYPQEAQKWNNIFQEDGAYINKSVCSTTWTADRLKNATKACDAVSC